MKAFFEEYGFVILSAIAIIALIGISNTVKTTVSADFGTLLTNFQTQVNKAINPST